jgi:hypothetical protein
MRKTLARITTNILNPFAMAFVIIVLLAFEGTDNATEAIKWASISVALSVLPALAAVIFLVRRKKLDGVFANPRQQRTGVYLLFIVLAAIAYGLLWYFGAPELLAAAFAAGLASACVFTVINLFWKISVHTAFLAGAVVILVMVYGGVAAWTVLLLPLVGWARMELRQHSLMQAATGAILAAAIVVGIFWGYGMVG